MSVPVMRRQPIGDVSQLALTISNDESFAARAAPPVNTAMRLRASYARPALPRVGSGRSGASEWRRPAGADCTEAARVTIRTRAMVRMLDVEEGVDGDSARASIPEAGRRSDNPASSPRSRP